MGVAKKTRKFGATKRVIGKRDARLKENKDKADIVNQKKKATINGELTREIPQAPSSMFFNANTALVSSNSRPVLEDVITDFACPGPTLPSTCRYEFPVAYRLTQVCLATHHPPP